MGEAAKGIPDESEVETAEKTRGPLLKCLLLVALLLGLSIAWRWTPISEWINFRTIVEWQNSVRAHPAALLFVVGTYLAGALVLFPVTILNVATVFTFGPIRGNAYGLAGWLASAALGYAIGRAFKHKLFHRFAGPRIDRLLEQAAGHGFLAVLTMRLLPVAPFTLVNIFIGTIPIRFRHFIMASVVANTLYNRTDVCRTSTKIGSAQSRGGQLRCFDSGFSVASHRCIMVLEMLQRAP